MGRLANKTAIITGGASGIGRTASEIFAREGAEVAIFDIDARGEAVAEAIRAAGGEASFHRADLTVEADVAAAVAAVAERYGKLDILYNNAGGSTPNDGPVTTCPTDEFWLTMNRDLFTSWLCTRHAVPVIARSGGGSVINTTSGRALKGSAGKNAYVAAKGAILSLTKAWAHDFAPDGIRVNAVCPGMVATDRALAMLAQSQAFRDRIERTHLLGLVEPTDIAMLAVYLASDEARVTTGQIFAADSGYLA